MLPNEVSGDFILKTSKRPASRQQRISNHLSSPQATGRPKIILKYMIFRKNPAKTIAFLLSSEKLALLLVCLLIFLSLTGILLPQEGMGDSEILFQWQKTHPWLAKLFQHLGGFHVFTSWPFLVLIFMLFGNTLTCTILHFFSKNSSAGLTRQKRMQRFGALALHSSLLLLMMGGFLSASTRMYGHVLLTEGQTFQEKHDEYLSLVEAPLRAEHHHGFFVQLEKQEIKLAQEKYQVDVSSRLKFFSTMESKPEERDVHINYPVMFDGVSFTQDETGFSPRLIIRRVSDHELVMDSYVALSTLKYKQERKYRDFLPIPLMPHKLVLTLYPTYAEKNGQLIKVNDIPTNPLLLLELKDEHENVISSSRLLAGSQIELGDYLILFGGLARWSSFLVTEDPGYPLVCIALLIGLAALGLRYGPELIGWFGRGDSV